MTHYVAPAPTHRRLRRGTAAVAAATTIIAGIALTPGAAQAAVSADAAVIINEVYGGGGNNGATHTHDFIELYNTSGEAVDLSGWSLQYASSTGTFNNVDTLTGVIDPGAFFLVQQAEGANTSGTAAPLPTPDDAGTLALSGSGGKIALVSSTTALSGSTGNAAGAESVVDFVGWGSSASDFAGSGPAPGTSNSTSVARNAAHDNTADNAADFTTGTPTPTSSTGSEPEEPGEPADPVTATIAEIQGTGPAAALAGQTVTTRGVVTASYPTGGFDGFVIQTPGTGGDLDLSSHGASHAIFVYTPAFTPPEIGAHVEVTGLVSDFDGLSEITPSGADDVVVLAETADPVSPVTTTWPTDDTTREALESMLLAPQGEFTVSDTYRTNQYGNVGLASGTTPLWQPTDLARPGSAEATAVAADNAARGVILDDGLSYSYLDEEHSDLTPAYVSLVEPVVVGATATFTAPVIVDWRNGDWKFNPTAPLVGDGSGDDLVVFSNVRTSAPAEVGGDISVASFNVLNYFTTLGEAGPSCQAHLDRDGDGISVRTGCDQRGAWDDEDFQRQQEKIVAAIEGLDADVVGLMEIENSAALGEQPDEATAALVDALNAAAGDPQWAYVPSSEEPPPIAEQDVITNAIIYRTAAVQPVGPARALGTQSGADQAFGNAREPLAQVFEPTAGGAPLLFVVNHFKSKGSPGPWPGDADAGDGQGASNESRVRQATALAEWVADIRGDVDAVVLAGDFNSYTHEDPMRVLYDDGYVDAVDALALGEATYSYGGQSGSLDHILLNAAAHGRVTGGDVWNINAGEAVALEYSRYNVHPTTFYEPNAYRSSDHDPVKIGLTADAAPVEVTLLGINDFHGRINADTVRFAGTVEQLRAEASGPVLFLSSGDNIGASLFASSVAQDQPTIDVLNALGLQASTVGNHEFDRGWADLRDRVQTASDAPQLGANVYLAGTDTPALPEYALLDAGDLTVGVIGAVTEETPALVSPAGITDLAFGDPVEAVNRVSATLSDGDEANGEADILVALYHEGAGAGTPDGATLEEELAGGGAFAAIVNDTDAEVDAIFTGHTHKEYAWSAPIPGTDRTRPVVQTGSYGANLGEIVLTIDPEAAAVTAHTERNVPQVTTDPAELVQTYPRVAAVNDIVTAALEAAAEVGDTAVAEVATDITTAHAGGQFVDGVWTGGTRDDRASESTLGNLVANTLRDTLADLPDGAVIGVTNPGGLRADLWDTQAEFGENAVAGMADGTISFSQANAVLPFNNTMALVTLTGAQFTTLLEQQWQRDEDGEIPSRPYLQLGLSDNVTYTYDPALPEGERITSVTVDGEPLDETAEYRIGTLSFLATGGDNFRVFTEGSDYVDTGLLDYEAWIDHLADHSPVTPDYAKHAVQVSGVPEAVAAGADVGFDVAGLDLTSRGAPENTRLEVALGDTALGEFAVTDGAAHVSITLPAGVEPGPTALTLTAPDSGTTVTVPLAVEDSGADSTTTLSLNRTTAAYGAHSAVRATARVTADGAAPTGVVEFLVDGEVIATAEIDRRGRAQATLALPGERGAGTYAVTARYVGDDEVTGSSSAAVEFTVTAARTITTLLPLLPVHINGLLPTRLVAVVSQSGGGEAMGVVEFRAGDADGAVVATVDVEDGIASHTLGRLSRGSHSYTAVFVPAAPDDVTGSQSRTVSVRVLF